MAGAISGGPPSAQASSSARPIVVVVMGVSGCGKSTVGQALATALGLRFVEGDALHPPQNVARMASGSPLTDADRQSWLVAVAQALAQGQTQTQTQTQDRGVVASCSALKRDYRNRLRQAAPNAVFVHLHGSAALLRQRLEGRVGHYMPAALLQSQLDILEPPGADEAAVQFDIAISPEILVKQLCQFLAQDRAAA